MAPHTTVSYNKAPSLTVCKNILGTSLHYSYFASLTTFNYNIFLALISTIHIWHLLQLLVIIFLGTSLHYSYLATVTSVADPYHFDMDPDPDPGCEKICSGSGSRVNFDLDTDPDPGKNDTDPDPDPAKRA